MNKIFLHLTSLRCMYIKLKINLFILKRQLRLNHVYNIYYGNAPSYLHESFKLKSAVSERNTRASSNEDFFLTRVKACQVDTFYCNCIKD